MSFNIVKGDELKVDGIIVLLYGDPSTGKTSTGFTSNNPILFDFDGGAHRSGFKIGKPVVRINNWDQIATSMSNLEIDLKDYDTIIIDTVETCLDFIRMYIEDKDYKLKTNGLKMYGKLKDEFYGFLNRIKTLKKNVILIAHATTDEQNGIIKTVPKITGGSKDIVRQKADFIGYMFMQNNKRTLNFNPTDYYEGKNSAGFKVLELPDYKEEPNFFAKKLEEMKNALMENSKSQDEALGQIITFTAKIEATTTADEFYALMNEMSGFPNAIKVQLWNKLKPHAEKLGYQFDAKEKKFHLVVKEEVVEPATNGTSVSPFSFE